MTHGDLSSSNIMRAGGDRWVAIDPDLTARGRVVDIAIRHPDGLTASLAVQLAPD